MSPHDDRCCQQVSCSLAAVPARTLLFSAPVAGAVGSVPRLAHGARETGGPPRPRHPAIGYASVLVRSRSLVITGEQPRPGGTIMARALAPVGCLAHPPGGPPGYRPQDRSVTAQLLHRTERSRTRQDHGQEIACQNASARRAGRTSSPSLRTQFGPARSLRNDDVPAAQIGSRSRLGTASRPEGRPSPFVARAWLTAGRPPTASRRVGPPDTLPYVCLLTGRSHGPLPQHPESALGSWIPAGGPQGVARSVDDESAAAARGARDHHQPDNRCHLAPHLPARPAWPAGNLWCRARPASGRRPADRPRVSAPPLAADQPGKPLHGGERPKRLLLHRRYDCLTGSAHLPPDDR